MADFDPDSLTWKVFCNVVREKHGHVLKVTRVINWHQGTCTACGLKFHPPSRLQLGPADFSRCPGTRPS